MAYRTTKKAIREAFRNKIVLVPYCSLQSMLPEGNRFAYSTRAEGWACDYHEIGRGICVSTGYAPIGKQVFSYEELKAYEKAAAEIKRNYELSWEEKENRLYNLISDFAGDCEARL